MPSRLPRPHQHPMPDSLNRRHFVHTGLASVGALAFTRCVPSTPIRDQTSFTRALAHLEPPHSRLGVAALDLQTGASLAHREQERFAMCSTFKLPLAALVLQCADRGELRLDERLSFTTADLVPHAPVVEQHLAEGALTIKELARAAQVTSDNVAANLLLHKLGGPSRLNQFFRQLGDDTSRLDDYEPMMNGAPPGALPNTTAPLAMSRLVAKIISANLLSTQSLVTLKRWMLETETGLNRLRAGFPIDWQAGDKTGTNMGKGFATRYNDVACVWFPNRAPLIVTCYLESTVETEQWSDEFQLVLARVGTVVARWAQRS